MMAAATKTASHNDSGRVLDVIFDVTFNSNQHNVWIQLKFLSNQACQLLTLLMFSTFMAAAKDNKDKLGLNNSKGISNTQSKYQHGCRKDQKQ
jgi:hypothetical protein